MRSNPIRQVAYRLTLRPRPSVEFSVEEKMFRKCLEKKGVLLPKLGKYNRIARESLKLRDRLRSQDQRQYRSGQKTWYGFRALSRQRYKPARARGFLL